MYWNPLFGRVVGSSKLQMEIATSTIEDKILIMALNDVIPIRQYFKVFVKRIVLNENSWPQWRQFIWRQLWSINVSKHRAWKFNSQVQALCTLKYHWFVEVKKTDIKEQMADILTKGMRKHFFLKTAKLLCGFWMFYFICILYFFTFWADGYIWEAVPCYALVVTNLPLPRQTHQNTITVLICCLRFIVISQYSL